jgi:hypothetical protein
MRYKVLSIFLIFTLLNVGLVAANVDNTAPTNSTENSTIIKVLPSEQEVTTFANASTAYDNITLENEIITKHPDWYFDTYIVKLKELRKDGKVVDPAHEITVVVIYDNKPSGKTNYGKVQLWPSINGIANVTPNPMLLCRPLVLTSIEVHWNFTTAPVESYKIVKSYMGAYVSNEDVPLIQPVEPTTQPNESTTTQVFSVTNETVVQVAENNTMYPVENATANDNSVNLNNSTNEGVIVGGNWIQNIMIHAENLYLTVMGK